MKLFSKILNKQPPATKRDIGSHYEHVALNFLQRHGLIHKASNFTTRYGELDLIMQHQRTLVFVEVKYRSNPNFGHAAEMVTTSKARKLTKTAMIWLAQHGYSAQNTDFRFDVIAIHQNGQQIDWIKNAITQG